MVAEPVADDGVMNLWTDTMTTSELERMGKALEADIEIGGRSTPSKGAYALATLSGLLFALAGFFLTPVLSTFSDMAFKPVTDWNTDITPGARRGWATAARGAVRCASGVGYPQSEASCRGPGCTASIWACRAGSDR